MPRSRARRAKPVGIFGELELIFGGLELIFGELELIFGGLELIFGELELIFGGLEGLNVDAM
jgi:hypothetical protein